MRYQKPRLSPNQTKTHTNVDDEKEEKEIENTAEALVNNVLIEVKAFCILVLLIKLPFVIKRILIFWFRLNLLIFWMRILVTAPKSSEAVGSPLPENAISLNSIFVPVY